MGTDILTAVVCGIIMYKIDPPAFLIFLIGLLSGILSNIALTVVCCGFIISKIKY